MQKKTGLVALRGVLVTEGLFWGFVGFGKL